MLQRPAILNGMEALVVDRTSRITPIIQMILEQHGVGVHGATSCQEALFTLRRRNCDFVLVDVGEDPEIGIRAIENIRHDARHRDRIIVALSSDETDREHRACVLAGADGVVQKPLNPADLVEKVKDRLEALRDFRRRPKPSRTPFSRAFERSRRLHDSRTRNSS